MRYGASVNKAQDVYRDSPSIYVEGVGRSLESAITHSVAALDISLDLQV